MKIETLLTAGMVPAMKAMRNPMNSWGRGDTDKDGRVGPNDRELTEKLMRSGPEHAKHLRMIMVWADIEAPMYWWKEFDTYRAGVEKVSCSTMHKITSRPFNEDDFEQNDNVASEIDAVENAYYMNKWLDDWREKKEAGAEAAAKDAWKRIIMNLPQSYLQKRTVVMSYAALRNICKQRANHKLSEWHAFRDWCKTLPESWMIIDE